MPKIGLAVEADSDETVYKKLLDRLVPGPHEWKPRATRRRGHGFVKEIPEICESFAVAKVKVGVFILDADSIKTSEINARLAQLRAELEGESRFTPVYGVVVRNLNALFLADETSFTRVFGVTVPRQPDPETIPNPVETLASVLSLCTHIHGELPEFHFIELSDHVRHEVIYDRCPHFAAIVDDIRDAL